MTNEFPTAENLRTICNAKLAEDQKKQETKHDQNYQKICKSLAECLSHQAVLGKESFEFLWTKLNTPFDVPFGDYCCIHERIKKLLDEKGFEYMFHEYSAQVKRQGKYGYLIIWW